MREWGDLGGSEETHCYQTPGRHGREKRESLQSQFCVSLCDLDSLVIHKAQILALSQECCFPMPSTWQLVSRFKYAQGWSPERKDRHSAVL